MNGTPEPLLRVSTDRGGQLESIEGFKKGEAVGICTLMALGYVTLLYAPGFCLPRPKSAQQHLFRRFAGAAVAACMAPLVCVNILPGRAQQDYLGFFDMFGISTPHPVAVIPTFLTSILYLGPLLLDLLDFTSWCATEFKMSGQWNLLLEHVWFAVAHHVRTLANDVLWWRNFIVTVMTSISMVSLAHVHHFAELVYRQRQPISAATLIVGLQLGYTTVFGWYATFLYLRIGNLLAPLVAHMFCNTMGLPDLGAAFASQHYYGVLFAYVVGLVGFFVLLGPLSNPGFFHDDPITSGCSCWLGYCKW